MSFMALIGLSIAIQPANHPGTAPGYIAVGSVIAGAFIVAIVALLTNRLVVTEHALTWRNLGRTRSVAWADVQDVLVVPANALGRYYSPAIKAHGRLIRINSVIGPRRYTRRVVAEIREAWAADLATGADTRQDHSRPAQGSDNTGPAHGLPN
jgi:Bacterial PH domain